VYVNRQRPWIDRLLLHRSPQGCGEGSLYTQGALRGRKRGGVRCLQQTDVGLKSDSTVRQNVSKVRRLVVGTVRQLV
jgi:hypothetical protein